MPMLINKNPIRIVLLRLSQGVVTNYFLGSNLRLLDDFKVALYVCQNHADDEIYSDHGYLDTLEIPLAPP